LFREEQGMKRRDVFTGNRKSWLLRCKANGTKRARRRGVSMNSILGMRCALRHRLSPTTKGDKSQRGVKDQSHEKVSRMEKPLITFTLKVGQKRGPANSSS